MSLVKFQTDHQPLSLMQSQWATELNPLLKNPALQSVILKNVDLINGTTIINHKLGRKLQGWKTVRVRAAATIYDTQDTNNTTEITLRLVSNAAVTVDLEVF